MTRMSDRERAVRQRLKDDFPHYARKCLKIRTKAGSIEPFMLNPVQMRLHEVAERQMREKGRVRIIVLKARQGGVSTYVEGRGYWRVSHRRGFRAYILTHRDEATANLFGITKRFHDQCPALVKPQTGRANAHELSFKVLDSSYRVATAKAIGVGRSDTIQFFHGSEVAAWSHAEEHATGVLQAIPDEAGTESWLEGTADGMGGYWYQMVYQALRGDGEYELVFLPWFDFDDYRSTPPADWECPPEFAEYGRLHRLDPDQMHWAHKRNSALAAADARDVDKLCPRFRQEYPATVEDAFQAALVDSFIPSEIVLRARRGTPVHNERAPIVLGCDVARGGGDDNYIISRQARHMGRHWNERFDSDDLVDVAAHIGRAIDATHAQMAFVDVTGLGAGVVDQLNALGYGQRVTGVHFGSKPIDGELYFNKRAEMYGVMREWLRDDGGAQIPDDERLHVELCAVTGKRDSNERIKLDPKEGLQFSPDAADAAALTFAYPVIPVLPHEAWAPEDGGIIEADPLESW